MSDQEILQTLAERTTDANDRHLVAELDGAALSIDTLEGIGSMLLDPRLPSIARRKLRSGLRGYAAILALKLSTKPIAQAHRKRLLSYFTAGMQDLESLDLEEISRRSALLCAGLDALEEARRVIGGDPFCLR